MLLVVYPFVLVAGWYALWRLLASGETPHPAMGGALFALVFAFLPVTQAMIQREFEVVALALFLAACLLLIRGREAASGATLAYLAWFKYWPIALLGAFVVHRRVRGLVAFAVASGAILLAAQLVFGLQHFVIGKTLATITGLVRPLGSGEVLYAVIPEGVQKSDFCRQWIWGRGTEAELRWALCGLEYRAPWFSAKAAFFGLIGLVAALFLWGAYRVQSAGPAIALAKWTTIWEFSILGIVGATFVHAHYYYYLVFVLPLGAVYLVCHAPAAVATAEVRSAGRRLPAAERVSDSGLVGLDALQGRRVDAVRRQRVVRARQHSAPGARAPGVHDPCRDAPAPSSCRRYGVRCR